jgi:hypothetical protein
MSQKTTYYHPDGSVSFEKTLIVTGTNLEVRVQQLERENAALRVALDQQANYQRELRADRDRLDWVCEHLFTTRAAIDAKLEEKR